MKKSALALAVLVVAGSVPTFALADDAPAAPAAPAASPITYNIGVVSDYRYRGISQSKLKPALQGGIDYADGPFYVAPGRRPSSGSRTRTWRTTAPTRATTASCR